MIKHNRSQFDFFTQEVYNKLVPEDHQLVKIDQLVDFESIFKEMSLIYSDIGRGSKDPVMMVKIMLLEYIYRYSDVQMEKAIQTDIAIRWFLRLNLDEKGPDASTISYFRVNRMTEKDTELFFNKVVALGIEKGAVKSNRFIVDTTDVAANSNYPSEKKLIHSAFENLIKLVEKEDPLTAINLRAQRTEAVNALKEINDDYSARDFALEVRKIVESIPTVRIKSLIQDKGFEKAFRLLFDLLKQQFSSKGNKIVSVVDPDARVAHKSAGNVKVGYKNHIIIDEDSELIISSLQTPFNVKDEKKLIEIIEKAEHDHGLKPSEVSCDKIYGTYENRQYLEERNIVGNIAFYDNSNKETHYFGIDDFKVSDDLEYVICPAGHKTYNYTYNTRSLESQEGELIFKFSKDKCKKCPLNDLCVRRKKGVKSPGARSVRVDPRYATAIKAKRHIETKACQTALNRRSIVERRFATLVRNHGLRRSRFLGMTGASKHIMLANTACNIVRLLKILQQPNCHTLNFT